MNQYKKVKSAIKPFFRNKDKTYKQVKAEIKRIFSQSELITQVSKLIEDKKDYLNNTKYKKLNDLKSQIEKLTKEVEQEKLKADYGWDLDSLSSISPSFMAKDKRLKLKDDEVIKQVKDLLLEVGTISSEEDYDKFLAKLKTIWGNK